MKANLANSPTAIEIEEVQFRVSLLRLVGEHTESLEQILTELQPVA